MADKLVTDMNRRERQRFVETLELLSQTTKDLSDALRSEDDSKLVAPALMFMMTFAQIKDLFEILAAAQMISTDDLEKGVGGIPDDDE